MRTSPPTETAGAAGAGAGLGSTGADPGAGAGPCTGCWLPVARGSTADLSPHVSSSSEDSLEASYPHLADEN